MNKSREDRLKDQLKEALIKYLTNPITPRIDQPVLYSHTGSDSSIQSLITQIHETNKGFRLKEAIKGLAGFEETGDPYTFKYVPPGYSVSNSAAASSVGYGGNSSVEMSKYIEDQLKKEIIRYLDSVINTPGRSPDYPIFIARIGADNEINKLIDSMKSINKKYKLIDTLSNIAGVTKQEEVRGKVEAIKYVPSGSSVSNSAAASSVGYGGNSSAVSSGNSSSAPSSAANVGGETILPASDGNSSAVGENIGETILARVGDGNSLGLKGGRRLRHRSSKKSKSRKSKKSRKGCKATRRRSA